MKIAVFHELPPGGARKATHEIVKELSMRHIIDLYYVDDHKNSKEESYYNQAYFYQFWPKIWHGNNWKVRLYKDTVELYKLAQLHKNIAKDIRARNYDLIFVNASKYIESPFILRFATGGLKFFYLHDPHDRVIYEKLLSKKQKIDPIRKAYGRIILFIRGINDKKNLDGADIYIANSKFTQEMFGKTYGKKSIVSYLGVDSKVFSPSDIKKEIDILYIGSHEPMDGYVLLEDSLSLMKIKPRVKALFAEEQWIADDLMMRDLYRRSKIVVCLAYNEPFGLVPLEAMSCGVPVIAISEGGYRESIVNDKTGYLVIRNPKKIAEKIEFLLTQEKYLNLMSSNAREHILMHWTWKKRVKNIEEILLSSLHG